MSSGCVCDECERDRIQYALLARLRMAIQKADIAVTVAQSDAKTINGVIGAIFSCDEHLRDALAIYQTMLHLHKIEAA